MQFKKDEQVKQPRTFVMHAYNIRQRDREAEESLECIIIMMIAMIVSDDDDNNNKSESRDKWNVKAEKRVREDEQLLSLTTHKDKVNKASK